MDPRSALFASILTVLVLLAIVGFCLWLLWRLPLTSTEKSFPPFRMCVLVLGILVAGMLIGSSPVCYPEMVSRVWRHTGLSPSEVRPIDAPVIGTDYQYDATKKVVTVLTKDKGLVVKEPTGSTFVLTGYTVVDPDNTTVYFQNLKDGRTSSEVKLAAK